MHGARIRMKAKMTAIILIVAVLTLGSMLSIAALPSVASNTSSKNFGELVWGDDTLWSMVVPRAPIPHPANSQSWEDLYEEAPQVPTAGFPTSPQSNACDHLGIVLGTNSTQCYHDHTIDVPPQNHGEYSAVWHVYLVVCLNNQPSYSSGSNSCTSETVSGVGFSGVPTTLNLASVVTIGGTQTPLTSVSAFEAAESAGVVSIIDTGVTFVCPVQAYKG